MAGLLTTQELDRVFNAWRRALRLDPLLSRLAMPELRPFAEAFNLGLTGDDDAGDLESQCNELVAQQLEPGHVIRITTFLAETFTDEVGATSGAVTKSLVSTLGHVCGILASTMVADASQLARHDPLTGLENRRAWNERMLEIQDGDPVTIAMLDLDGLKQVNDTLGHDEGDKLLRTFGSELVEVLPEGAIAYRLGGDEYAVAWKSNDENQLEQAFKGLQEAGNGVAFSFGVASRAGETEDVASLSALADRLMYRMKANHKQEEQQPTAD